MFFLSCFHSFNQKFKGLFGSGDDNVGSESGGSSRVNRNFIESFGWMYNAKMVSEFEAIPLNDVWDLPVVQFLNDLNYLKQKRLVDDEQQKQLINEYK